MFDGGTDDAEARRFADYFAARRDSVRRTAYLLCGDWYWADDLTQAAFVRLASGWHRVRDPGALDHYLRTCLVRAYFSEARRGWRRREEPTAEPPDHGVGHEEEHVRRLAFARALAEVPPRQRITLVYRYYLGLDIAATAEALGCSEGTVKSQTARGLDRLRQVLLRMDIVLTPSLIGGREGRA
jgi:RNA polymerase sigma-70 factor (sigma-E family)